MMLRSRQTFFLQATVPSQSAALASMMSCSPASAGATIRSAQDGHLLGSSKLIVRTEGDNLRGDLDGDLDLARGTPHARFSCGTQDWHKL